MSVVGWRWAIANGPSKKRSDKIGREERERERKKEKEEERERERERERTNERTNERASEEGLVLLPTGLSSQLT